MKRSSDVPGGGESARVSFPPLRFGSESCAQIYAGVLPSHAISTGARCQASAPGTRACGRFWSWWQLPHCIAGTPRSAVPRTAGGSWIACSSPCRGESSGGWQFSACERAAVGSPDWAAVDIKFMSSERCCAGPKLLHAVA